MVEDPGGAIGTPLSPCPDKQRGCGDGDIVELGNFLWNLAHISNLEDLRTLSVVALQERLRKEWVTQPGPAARIIGIIEVVRPNTAKNLKLPKSNWEGVSEKLLAWLTQNLAEKHPYAFAQTVTGLGALNDRVADEVLMGVFRQSSIRDECLQLLQDGLAEALTPRSKVLLTKTLEFIR